MKTYACRCPGPAFIEEVRAKQRGNPEYDFLNGGQGAAYFYWTLYNLLDPSTLQPLQPSMDPLCFPPGLLPTMVADRLRTEPAYTPLRVKDVLEHDVPPMPVIDDYLTARLDKFHAQLADFRPGMSFTDLEPRTIVADTNQLSGPGRQSRHSEGASGGLRGAGGKGLGYGGGVSGSASGAEDSMYASFRQMQSQGYHNQVVRFAAGK